MKKSNLSFNTASGKHCCNNLYTARSNKYTPVSIPQAVSTVATYSFARPILAAFLVSIPQAVSTVATRCLQLQQYRQRGVSIPQAVSTVATFRGLQKVYLQRRCFNTASGKHCCNSWCKTFIVKIQDGFNTASGKHCCNFTAVITLH